MVAFDGAHQGQSYAGVAARRLDDGGAGLQDALCLCVLNHGQRNAVLHAAAGIKILYLGNDGRLKTLCL